MSPRTWFHGGVKRRLATITVLGGLLLAACTGSSSDVESNAPAVAAADVQVANTPPTSQADGIVVPNFSLTLADGQPFDLAAADTPVYLMFWAEW
jgi:multidrug efflux pump subunit AcrA (membrane-fusion protein)